MEVTQIAFCFFSLSVHSPSKNFAQKYVVQFKPLVGHIVLSICLLAKHCFVHFICLFVYFQCCWIMFMLIHHNKCPGAIEKSQY